MSRVRNPIRSADIGDCIQTAVSGPIANKRHDHVSVVMGKQMSSNLRDLSDFMTVVVSKEEVDSGDISPALGTFKLLLQSPETMEHFFERVEIAFQGYDSDSRELFEIPDVRQYVHKLDEQFPFWLFFLAKTHPGLQCLMLCFLPPHLTREAKVRQFPGEIDKLLSRRWFPAMNQVCAKVSFSDTRIHTLTDRVIKYMMTGPAPLQSV